MGGLTTARRSVDALSPSMFMLFFFFQEFFLTYIYAISTHSWKNGTTLTFILSVRDIHLAFLATLFYVAFWFVGYALPVPAGRGRPLLSDTGKRASPFWMFSYFLAPVTFFVLAWFANPNRHFAYRMELTQGFWGKILFIAIFFMFGAFLLSGSRLLMGRQSIRAAGNLMLVLLMATVIMAVLLPLGGRGRAVIALLYMVVMWHYFVKPLSIVTFWGIVALGTALTIIAGYPAALIRHPDASLLEVAFGTKYVREIDTLYNLANAMKGIELGFSHFNYGTAFLADVAGDLGIRLPYLDSRQIFMTQSMQMPAYLAGMPLSRPGEFYLAGGWLAIAIGGIVLGYLSKIFYLHVIKRQMFGSASVAVYITFMMWSGISTPDRYFFNNLVQSVFGCVCIIFLAVTLYGYRLRSTPDSYRSPVRARSRDRQVSTGSDGGSGGRRRMTAVGGYRPARVAGMTATHRGNRR